VRDLKRPRLKREAPAALDHESGVCDRGRGVARQMTACADAGPDARTVEAPLQRGRRPPASNDMFVEAQLAARADDPPQLAQGGGLVG
jgi:hypothetical protein